MRIATLRASNALQVHNRYLVVETDDGIEVIDQHALHERILYEQIREKVLAGRSNRKSCWCRSRWI